MFRLYNIFRIIKQEGLQGCNLYVIWYMATGTKLQGVVISGIRHGVNDVYIKNQRDTAWQYVYL